MKFHTEPFAYVKSELRYFRENLAFISSVKIFPSLLRENLA